jgi:adenylate cyclase
VQLYEVGGIGAPYHLALPARSTALVPLKRPLSVCFTVLEEKFVGRTVYAGRLTAACEREASMESEAVLPRLSNLRLELEAAEGENPRGEIYAKVVGQTGEGSGPAVIRYTSVTPELKIWLRKMSIQPSSAEAATL